jgi:hypothetical protein
LERKVSPRFRQVRQEVFKKVSNLLKTNIFNYAQASFNQLRLWQDANHNGISEPNELKPLLALDVTAIELNFRESKRTDEFGNRFQYRSKIWDARNARAGRWAWDVFLVIWK